MENDAADFLAPMGLQVNAAGPVLVVADPPRGRILAANANSSSFTVVDKEDAGSGRRPPWPGGPSST